MQTKCDLEKVTRIDKLKLTKKVDLASLKPDVDRLDIDELEIPIDLSKLSNVVRNYVVKNIAYDELVKT